VERVLTWLLCACVLALAAAPASAHVRRDGRTVEPAVFGDRPIALAAQQPEEPGSDPAPRAKCGAGARPEPGMQGRIPAEEISSGRASEGYRCNITQIGHSGSTGGFKVLRYVDRNGHECAYYDTTLLFPTNALSLSLEPTGVAVLDMSDPANPQRTTTLLTPAMQSPHESLNISVERGLLAAVMGTPAFAPGVVDVYDIADDCRRPRLLSSSPVGLIGHESGMALDGKTFYATSISTDMTTAVDLTNPQVPLPLWVGQYNTHGMTLSDDGNRGYLAAGDGLIILDLSEVQARKPDPQVREISRLVWSNITIPQVAHPVTIDGKPYLVEIDEFSADESGGVTAHGARVGAARIIDISDETKPFVVSNIRLEVHQPENREAIANDPGAQNPVQGYAGHYCNVPQRREPGILACSMIASGLRVFDIRDPEKPKEIGYFMSPPSTISATGGPVIDERSNWAMSQPAFAPERGEIWYSDGNSGFYALKMAEDVWPFATGAGCGDTGGFARVSAKPAGTGVRIGFERRLDLPVTVDVFRVSQGRRVLRERRVARFRDARESFTWTPRAGRGHYFVRFRMFRDGKQFETRRVVLQRTAKGFARRPAHHLRDTCGLLRRFKLERPVFGGPAGKPLRAAFELASPARVTITVSRGDTVVKRFATRRRAAGRTFRVALPATGLPRGDYTVRLHAGGGEDQISAKLVARRL
jgi:hypothetical protein